METVRGGGCLNRKAAINGPQLYYFVEMDGLLCAVRKGDEMLILTYSRKGGHC